MAEDTGTPEGEQPPPPPEDPTSPPVESTDIPGEPAAPWLDAPSADHGGRKP